MIQREVFGPVDRPALLVDEEAIEWANGVDYGLRGERLDA